MAPPVLRMPTFTAVSYTHLDVYKRQASACSLQGEVRHIREAVVHHGLIIRIVACGNDDAFPGFEEDVFSFMLADDACHSAVCAPVSYTHLDVYKRQRQG